MELNTVFNSTHVKETPIVGKYCFVGKSLVGLFVSYSEEKKCFQMEVYFYKKSISDHFYTSRMYNENKIPAKYKAEFKMLVEKYNVIQELPIPEYKKQKA